MKLSKPAKILVLILTIFPLIYMGLFLAMIAATFTSRHEPDLFSHFGIFMAIHIGVILLMFALLAFYIVFLFKTNAVKNDMKALWAIVLFFGGPIAMPVFWYLYIWRSPATS